MKRHQLTKHFAAHIAELRRHGRHEAAVAVSKTAVSIAIEIFATQRKRAVAFLDACNVAYAGHHYDAAVAALLPRRKSA